MIMALGVVHSEREIPMLIVLRLRVVGIAE
jgi:hypothetical protein